jgi:hypothetical protein
MRNLRRRSKRVLLAKIQAKRTGRKMRGILA